MQLGILGSGTYGLVIRARDTSDPDAQDVAIKLLPRGGFVSASSQRRCRPNCGEAQGGKSIAPRGLHLPVMRSLRALRLPSGYLKETWGLLREGSAAGVSSITALCGLLPPVCGMQKPDWLCPLRRPRQTPRLPAPHPPTPARSRSTGGT